MQNNVLFLDIETLPGTEKPSLEEIEAPKNYKDVSKIQAYKEEKQEEIYRQQALNSMKGQLLCIGWAFNEDPVQVSLIGLDVMDEPELIACFGNAVLSWEGYLNNLFWCGHNLRSFDLSWIWRKSLQYGETLLAKTIPRQKWSKQLLDTMDLWAADFKDHVSLSDIAKFLGLEGKQEGMNGSQVYDLWQAGELEKIRDYCKQDVELTRQVYKAIVEYQPIQTKPSQVEYVTEEEECLF